MTFKTALSSTQISLRSLARISAGAGAAADTYDVCTIDMPPAFVLARLLDVLGTIDPAAHARLTGPGSTYRAIPAAALDDSESRWWSGPEGTALIGGIVGAINAAAHPRYSCVLHVDGQIALAPLCRSGEGGALPQSTRYRQALPEERPRSGERRAVRRRP